MNKVNLTFLCNFKPNYINKKNICKKKIFCKNFIIFIMFLKFFNNFGNSFFIKPLKKKSFSILKAPHRFKTSRHLLKFSRYLLYITIDVSKTTKNLDIFKITTFFKDLFYLLKKIDSSICYQKFIKISFKFSYKSIFHVIE